MPYIYNSWNNLQNVNENDMNSAFDDASQKLASFFPIGPATDRTNIGCICSGIGSFYATPKFGQVGTSSTFALTNGSFRFPSPTTQSDTTTPYYPFGDLVAGSYTVNISGAGTQYVCAQLQITINTTYRQTLIAAIYPNTQTTAQIAASSGTLIPLFILTGNNTICAVSIDNTCAYNYGDMLGNGNVDNVTSVTTSGLGITASPTTGDVVITSNATTTPTQNSIPLWGTPYEVIPTLDVGVAKFEVINAGSTGGTANLNVDYNAASPLSYCTNLPSVTNIEIATPLKCNGIGNAPTFRPANQVPVTTGSSEFSWTTFSSLGLTGEVKMYSGTVSSPTAISGFLLCDGASYSTTIYAALFNVIGYTYGGSSGSFNVPDMRGMFARGLGGNSAGLGVSQACLLQTHQHLQAEWDNVVPSGMFGVLTVTPSQRSNRGDSGTSDQAYLTSDGSTTLGANPNPGGQVGIETRPINMALNFIIKT